jgi:hypothetical protein
MPESGAWRPGSYPSNSTTDSVVVDERFSTCRSSATVAMAVANEAESTCSDLTALSILRWAL